MGVIKNRTGETCVNKWGSKMTIIEYISFSNITVKFEDGNMIKKCQYGRFKEKNIKNPYDKTVYDIGYIGEGNYKAKINGEHTQQYKFWSSMMRRCYQEKSCERRNITYEDKIVCMDWHNFQNFADWFDDNYYEIDNEVMQLDKDILYKGNKIYSPDNCIIVPLRINNLFTKSDSKRGDYPIGVSYCKDTNSFKAYCSIIQKNKKKQKHLGLYQTPEEAFYKGYKPFKETYIKEVAEDYKSKIPIELYKAMYNWIVEIDD
jgi:hypothetical protein